MFSCDIQSSEIDSRFLKRESMKPVVAFYFASKSKTGMFTVNIIQNLWA